MNFDAEYGRQYDQNITRLIPGYELIFQMANSFLQSALPENAAVLVIGAGSGKEIVTFGSANPGWAFYGVEPAEQMITFAKQKTAQAGINERVKLLHGYSQDVPADLRFDAATCILVFSFVYGDEAKLAILKDISARLKPGAPLVIVTACDEAFREDFRRIWRDHQVMRGANVEDASRAEANVRTAVQHISATRLLELLDDAGFENPVPFFRALWFAGWFVSKKVE